MDAGIAHQYVYATVICDDIRNSSIDFILVADIYVDINGAATCLYGSWAVA